jgi:hypothetical protein
VSRAAPAGAAAEVVGRVRRAVRPSSAAGRVLLALIVVGVALRLLVIVSWWPVAPTLEDGYQRFASNPFLDSQHPAGYALIVAGLGDLTRQIAFTVLLQHVAGLASALLLGSATRRVTGSSWAGLLPAGIVLLDPDVIFLEHSIMSESWMILALSVGLYAAVRACEAPERWWPWPLLSGSALAAAVMIRSAALPVIAVAAVAILVYRPRSQPWRRHCRGAAAAVATAAILLLAFAGANAAFGQRFGIEPSPGWYLYGRVAQFADCRDFTPPPGTRSLCQTVAPARRPSSYDYMFVAQSPAVRLFGSFGADDGAIGVWARRAALAQPGAFFSTAWAYLRSYWIPAWLPARLRSSTHGLDPQLDFTYPNVFYVAAIKRDLESYYDRFDVHPLGWGLRLLHDWQRVIRFGATALFITTILTLIGLAVGPRRSRVGVLLFGLGGLSLIVAPALTGTYSGRYTVPMAGPLMAAAAISLTSLWQAKRRNREAPGGPGAELSP